VEIALQELVKELLEILDAEKNIYDGLLNTSKDKTKIIVEGKVDELDKITKMEQSAMLQMSKLEDKREKIINRMASITGEKAESLTVSKLIDYVDNEDGIKLRSMKDGITKVLTELKELNALNSKLIENSLEYINFSLNLFASVGVEDNNYNMGAEKLSNKGKNFLDFKV
jgi:flagellar biosynthesis/type III secretory pathway chaperone